MGVSSNFTLLPSFFVVFKELSVSFSQFEITEAGSVVNYLYSKQHLYKLPIHVSVGKKKNSPTEAQTIRDKGDLKDQNIRGMSSCGNNWMV